MKVAERRKAIVNLLLSAKEPISGGALAQRFNISRQIIVQDITVLKGTGYEILSTSQGYVMQKSPLAERVFKVRHTTDQTEDELSCIVNLGGTVVDVFVWHKVYGRIDAPPEHFLANAYQAVPGGGEDRPIHRADAHYRGLPLPHRSCRKRGSP